MVNISIRRFHKMVTGQDVQQNTAKVMLSHWGVPFKKGGVGVKRVTFYADDKYVGMAKLVFKGVRGPLQLTETGKVIPAGPVQSEDLGPLLRLVRDVESIKNRLDVMSSQMKTLLRTRNN